MNTSTHPLMDAVKSGQAFTAKQWIKSLSMDEGHVFLDALDVALDERSKWGHDRCVRVLLNHIPDDERLRSIAMARMVSSDRLEYLKLMAREQMVDRQGMMIAMMAAAEHGFWDGVRVLEQFGAPDKCLDYVRSAMWSKDASMVKHFAAANFTPVEWIDIIRYAAERDMWSKEIVEAVYDFDVALAIFGTKETLIKEHIKNAHLANHHVQELIARGRLNEDRSFAPPLH